VTGTRVRAHTHLLDDLKETRRFCEPKREEVDHTLWRTSFGRSYEPVIRHATDDDDDTAAGDDNDGGGDETYNVKLTRI
jgi:hypothetical protein